MQDWIEKNFLLCMAIVATTTFVVWYVFKAT